MKRYHLGFLVNFSLVSETEPSTKEIVNAFLEKLKNIQTNTHKLTFDDFSCEKIEDLDAWEKLCLKQ